MVTHICAALRNRKPDVAQPWLHKLPRFAAKLELFLFLTSTSLDQYTDTSTIAPRLQRLARVLRRRLEPAPATNLHAEPSRARKDASSTPRLPTKDSEHTGEPPIEFHLSEDRADANSWQWSEEDHNVHSNGEPWEEESNTQSNTHLQAGTDHEAFTHDTYGQPPTLEDMSSTHEATFQGGEPATHSAPFTSENHSKQEVASSEGDLEAGKIEVASDEVELEAEKSQAVASSNAADARTPKDHVSTEPHEEELRGLDTHSALDETSGNDAILHDTLDRPTEGGPLTADDRSAHEASSHRVEPDQGDCVGDTASTPVTCVAPHPVTAHDYEMREQLSPKVVSSAHDDTIFHGVVDPTASGPLSGDQDHNLQEISSDEQKRAAAHSNEHAPEASVVARTDAGEHSPHVLTESGENPVISSADQPHTPPNTEKNCTDNNNNDTLLFRRRSHWPSASAREAAEQLLLSGNHSDALEVVFSQVTLEAQPTVLTSLANLAKRKGKYDAALAANGALVDSAESIHLAAALSARGDLLYYLGRLAEAQAAYERALEVREHVYAPGHETTFNILNNIGVVAELQGNTAKAKESYQRAIDIKNDDAVRVNLLNLVRGATSDNTAAILDEPSYMTLERPSTVPTNASRRQRPGARVLREQLQSDGRSHPKPPNAPRRGGPAKHNRNLSSNPSRATTRPATSTGLRRAAHLGNRR